MQEPPTFKNRPPENLLKTLPLIRRSWRPSWLARTFLRAKDAHLTIDGAQALLKQGGTVLKVPPTALRCVKGRFFTRVVYTESNATVLSGLFAHEAQALEKALTVAALRLFYAEPERLFPGYAAWFQSARRLLRQKEKRGWIWLEDPSDGTVPPFPCASWVPQLSPQLARFTDNIRSHLFYAQGFGASTELAAWVKERNRQLLASRLRDDAAFFDSVESKPLTAEQRCAVASFAPRTLVIAAAGSGKTSVLSAKCAYALQKGFFRPEEILLLAFNHKAAEELRARLSRAFPLETEGAAQRVHAFTFHAFALSLLGQSSGAKPSVASFISQNKELEVLQELVNTELQKPGYRAQFQLYEALFTPQAPSRTSSGAARFVTRTQVEVRSEAERLLADWLTHLGLSYEYERCYEAKTADAAHRAYHPDFYLTESGLWIELWALADEESEPADFAGYQKAKAWKRALHSACGTTLLEITARSVHDGSGFAALHQRLQSLGALKRQSKSAYRAPSFAEVQRLTALLRTFQIHAYNNNRTVSEMRDRIKELPERFGFRESLLLTLYEPIERAWCARLQTDEATDFEHMLLEAAKRIESGAWKSPYRLILVDEFQDTSRLRARLLKALLKTPGTRLFAVGDDWQSINRFAGSDSAVMRCFEDEFGASERLILSETFRCNQRLADAASYFIQKNPEQLPKAVRARQAGSSEALRLYTVKSEPQIALTLRRILSELNALGLLHGKKRTVGLLGRYRRERTLLPRLTDYPNLALSFSTIHAAKGLEFEHVIVLKMQDDPYLGFPALQTDDPVLSLVMPEPESYPFAEKRRLLYVALTRAKASCALIALEKDGVLPRFASELLSPQKTLAAERIECNETDAPESAARVAPKCPACGRLMVMRRRRQDGALFFGCSAYPFCQATQPL